MNRESGENKSGDAPLPEVLLGLSGGIAAYRACEIVSALRDECAFTAIMTWGATRFITPLTLRTLTGRAVLVDLFDVREETGPGHIAAGDRADLLVVAPATANIIAKLAHGIADDALTTVALSLQCPVILAPAMNPRMWTNRAVQRNIEIVTEWGWRIVGPGVGHVACGHYGAGRLAEPSEIVQAIRRELTNHA